MLSGLDVVVTVPTRHGDLVASIAALLAATGGEE